MSERTDERTEDVDDLLDDDFGDVGGGTEGVGADGQVGLSDDELGVDVDALTSGPGGDTGGTGAGPDSASASRSGGRAEKSGPGLLSRLKPSVGRPKLAPNLPSGRSFLLAFVLVIGGMLAGSAVPLVGTFGSAVGIFAGAFVLGLASGTRRYFPVAVAGAAAAMVSVWQGAFFRFAMLSDVGLAQFAAVGATTGIVVALLGHYFGRDLRAGLTRDV
ncbi:MAG: hypothetical protein ABEJ26_08505 [Halosimplex sp.]